MTFRTRLLASVFVPLLVTVGTAKADTFSVQTVYTRPVEVFAVNDYGDYTLLLGAGFDHTPQCDLNAQSCFLTHYAASNTTAYSSEAPALSVDPNPIAGSGCGVSVVDFTALPCINGHQYYTHIGAPQEGLFSSPDFASNIYGGSVDGKTLISPNGNVLFEDGQHDTEVLVLDLTTAPAPEPGSIALLGSGLAMAGAFARRRRA